MKDIFGDTKQLRASQRQALERLTAKRSNPREVLDVELAKRACGLCAQLQQQIGLLVGRDGEVSCAILASGTRLYLPDLGRYRLEGGRLRRLRLLVFAPLEQLNLTPSQRQSFIPSKRNEGRLPLMRQAAEVSARDLSSQEQFLSPIIPPDLLTDLDKLRLDCVVVVAVSSEGDQKGVSLAYLVPEQSAGKPAAGITQQKGFGFYHGRDFYDLRLEFDSFIREVENSFRAAHVAGFDTGKDHAVLVGAYTCAAAEAQSRMDELQELARTAEIQVLDCFTQRRRELDPRTLIGKGKIEQLVLHCLDLDADLLVFDGELTPGQLRSISNLTELRVIDRSMLILDIFAQRAKSSEGRLQVELAQLKYSLPRLTERDTGLSRLTGGIGGRGPGETKLEISRRRVRDRIANLEKQIEKLAQQRSLRRKRRQVRGVPVIAIVGYTNSGKSTLLNALTKQEVLAESKLFATLDPASKRMRFPNDKEVIFVDTVGFIRDLPKELINAFRATLEEVGEANLLLHLVDAANPESKRQIEVVNNTLASLGFGDTPRMLVLNKCDLLSELEVKMLVNTLHGLPLSAAARRGFDVLIPRLQQELTDSFAGQDPGRFTEIAPGEGQS